MRDGRGLKETNADPLGSPERPLSEEFLRDKFMTMAVPALGEKHAQKLWLSGKNLATVSNIKEWTSLLR